MGTISVGHFDVHSHTNDHAATEHTDNIEGAVGESVTSQSITHAAKPSKEKKRKKLDMTHNSKQDTVRDGL